MLGNLDNEIIFKKAFTNKTVFKAFVRDILGIDIEVDKIETEKRFEPKIGYIDFELDIFAESIDKRIVIEIQRIEYDHHFDRFLHYFLMLIAEQQKKAKEYSIDRTVYVIVVLTAPYKISEKNGKPILDEVLLLTLNPQTLKGEIRDMFGHQLVCLNPNHPDPDTPPQIRDWLDLIYQSIHSPGYAPAKTPPRPRRGKRRWERSNHRSETPPTAHAPIAAPASGAPPMPPPSLRQWSHHP